LLGRASEILEAARPATGRSTADAGRKAERNPRWVSNLTRREYVAAVNRALAYIAAGDIYQVNLSQRFEARWGGAALDFHLALRSRSPSRYGCFLDLGGKRAVCSVSPELFLRRRGRKVLTRPIKGTRPRGRTPEEERRLAAELKDSPKERAELNMIVDLERNDLGRVCEYGSVRVESAGELERHPTVWHRVATVSGRLREACGTSELLAATFPGGSVTGAPKLRAMEIIEDLDPARRGLYCGALGWLGADGDLELNLAIRTALADREHSKVFYQAGGGLVADSEPEREYEETLIKAAAFFEALRGE
jgi:para-aminobenzoate synthetase component 1